MSTQRIKICFLPGRETNYSRNRVLIAAMKSAGIEVLDCSCPKKNFLRYFISFKNFLKYQKDCDLVFVGFLGHFFMPFVKLVSHKKILLDIFVSIYQTLAFDRKSIYPHGPRAMMSRGLDKTAWTLADHVFCDTQQHIDYFAKEYNLPKEKSSRLFVGSDESVMYPRLGLETKKFLVHFHGEFQALHGARVIVEAARSLPDVQFQMVGKGKDSLLCRQLAETENLRNIKFIDPVPYQDLPNYIAQANVCLGIFGGTEKTKLVIPIKVYEYLAMSKPIITADTPAVRELLTHEENVILCPPADSAALVKAIERLRQDSALRQKIAANGYQIFKENCSAAVLGLEIRGVSERILTL